MSEASNMFTIGKTEKPETKVVVKKPDVVEKRRESLPLQQVADVVPERFTHMRQYTAVVKRPEREIVGRESELRQIKAALQRPELCNVMLLAPAGSGKAFKNGTLVPVADERCYVEIQDLKIGDMVFDDCGIPTEVLGVYPQGLKQGFQVAFGEGSGAICNDEHLWSVKDYKNPSADYDVVSLRDIMNKSASLQFAVPNNGAIHRAERDFDVHPYVMGFLLSSCLLNEYSLTAVSSDKNVVEYFAGLIDAYPIKKDETNHWYFIRRCYAVGLISLLSLGGFDDMFGSDVQSLRIPREYYLGSVEQRIEFFNGLIGACKKSFMKDARDFKLLAYSEDYANDIKEFAATLGIRTRIVQSSDEADASWLVCFEAYSEGGIPIVEISDLHTDFEMTCIRVAAESHLFQVGKEHIVTHNTMLVQGSAMADPDRLYLEIDLAKMIADLNDPNEMAAKLKTLFDEASDFVQSEKRELVLFMDEFHQVVQLSVAAVEALKPILADSGTRGVRVIAATTYVEFRQWIMPNQPLVERLQRVNVPEPDRATTVLILKGMAERYGVIDDFYDDHIFELIYDYTNRYIPANSQPRKSIIMLDAMVGWNRAEGRALDKALLADIIYTSEGINVSFKVNALGIKKELDKYVLAQHLASTVIEERLQICVAELNNTGKPMSSFLFTGSTGVGKALPDSVMVPVYAAGNVGHKRNGSIEIGDKVFNRKGVPIDVVGVFPQGECDVYNVHLSDGRYLPCNIDHLWGVYTDEQSKEDGLTVLSTRTLLNRGVPLSKTIGYKPKFFIPASEGVAWPVKDYSVAPYIVGAFIGDTILGEDALFLREGNHYAVNKASKSLGLKYKQVTDSVDLKEKGFDWAISLSSSATNNFASRERCSKAWNFFEGVPNMRDKALAKDRHIPDTYMTGSYAQRWELIKGLFDMRGRIDEKTSQVVYTTSYYTIAADVSKLLFSLGISNELYFPGDYEIWIAPQSCDERQFFTDPDLLLQAEKAYEKKRQNSSSCIGIEYIEKLSYRESMTCIYVNDPEHLYQAGNFVVTHNTEMAKQLARILFNDDRSLLRFDMTEYALDDSLERFRTELTNRIWEKPYSIVLLDEIEKACAPVSRLLLQVLDDGRLVNANNRETSFRNCYIIVTTNAGSEVFAKIARYNVSNTGDGAEIEKYMKLIRESIIKTTGNSKFPPELLGRISSIVPFQPLSETTMKKIVEMSLNKIKATIKEKHNIDVKIDDKVIRYLVEDNLDTESDSGGARVVMSKLESKVVTNIARFINANPYVRKIGVLVKGELAADNKKTVDSTAYIEVKQIRD